MKREKKIILCLCVAAPLFLSSCADTEWPKWISGEPTRAELESYQGPIAMPPLDTSDKPYPNLADVPERPKIATTPAERAATRNDMQADNEYGQSLVDTYQRGAAPVLRPPQFKRVP